MKHERTRKIRSLSIWGVVGLLLVTPSLLPLFDSCRVSTLRTKAQTLKIGDSKDTVESILGQPDAAFTKGSGLLDGALFGLFPISPERWAYGSMFDWENAFRNEFPYFYPFRFRLFGPDSDDIAVTFDDNGKVSAVIIPSDDPEN